jgi:hypothetical protein
MNMMLLSVCYFCVHIYMHYIDTIPQGKYFFFCNIHAVKLLDWGEDGFATEAETAALRTSFKQEVAVWHKLNHPNVTKVHSFSHTWLQHCCASSCLYIYLLMQ